MVKEALFKQITQEMNKMLQEHTVFEGSVDKSLRKIFEDVRNHLPLEELITEHWDSEFHTVSPHLPENFVEGEDYPSPEEHKPFGVIAFDIIPEIEFMERKGFFSFLQLRFHFVSKDCISLVFEVPTFFEGYKEYRNPDLSPFQYTARHYYSIRKDSDDIMPQEGENIYGYFHDARREEHQRLARTSTKGKVEQALEPSSIFNKKDKKIDPEKAKAEAIKALKEGMQLQEE